ncbi:MAG: hypothetical protein IJ091_05040 [Oscillospiraceae bacterium]|nr:hypothetical protein [Oscillospiraceae bacterium]
MRNKTINSAMCDARNVTEESLAGFDSITINSGILITGERSKALLNRYPVTMNVGTVLEVPDGQDIRVEQINGKGEIGPNADGTGVFLMVNGRLTIANDSLDAAQSYYRIMVNGKIVMPRSYQGQVTNIEVNGSIQYYPDGATILKSDSEIDDLFLVRATNPLYFCPGNLYFLDDGIDIGLLQSKGLRFGARRIVVAKSLLGQVASLVDEESEIIRVPDGTRLVGEDVDLKPKTIRRYGTKLFVRGDVTMQDEEALRALEYLYVDGTLRVDKNLEELFDEVECYYEDLKFFDPSINRIEDRTVVKIGSSMLKNHPAGLIVEDCAKVVLAEDISPEDILEKLHIQDCALVVCSEEQEDSVNLVARDVAMVHVSGREEPRSAASDILKGMLGMDRSERMNTQVINVSEYKM